MILVTGGAGVMGSRLVRGLVEKGDKVRVLTLPKDPFVSRLEGLDVDIRYGDVSNAESVKDIFDGVKTIYHLAAVLIAKDPAVFDRVNVQGTRNMIQGGIHCGAEHFIFVSSASVVYPHTTAYSVSKRKCEEMVRQQTAMKWTIVRPTLAYNEYGGEEFMMFMDYLKKYPVVPFIGTGRALKRPVHVDDLMRGFLAIPGNPKSYYKTFAFSGGEAVPIWDMAKLMLKHQKISKPFVPVPISVCKAIAGVMAKTMKKPPLTWNAIAGVMQDANLDNTDAQRDLGYKPIGFREGMQKCFPI
jgi:nucleoside-diphosphate-sugar epimerase